MGFNSAFKGLKEQINFPSRFHRFLTDVGTNQHKTAPYNLLRICGFVYIGEVKSILHLRKFINLALLPTVFFRCE